MGKFFNWLKGNKAEKEAEERARRELNERIRQYGDGNTRDPQKAMEFLLHVGLHGVLGTEEIVEGDHLVLPEWNATLTPAISQLEERGVVLDFYLNAPQWGKELYECCAGMGTSTGQAMGMAIGSLAFTFLPGIARMERREHGRPLTSTFAGREHQWQAYISDVAVMGKLLQPRQVQVDTYWELLKEDIVKRLGNQQLCYVKIYGAKVGDEVTGECRIDDIKSEELSAKVAQLVKDWKVEDFASQKQFFFLRQEEATTLPNPYAGREGQAALKAKVIQAVRLFHEAHSREDFDAHALETRLAQELGDATLAAECLRFLPEICAENAYQEQTGFAESVQLVPMGRIGQDNTVYKNQLADFYPMWKALFEAFQEGAFGDETNDIYRELIGYSAICHCLEKARQEGSSLEGGTLSALLIPINLDFVIR
ncbi:MAG: hypothetical protein HFF50_04850 [Lawsonibacter sp.]|nr:hypothetical protein [Lawsonibacter sp.]